MTPRHLKLLFVVFVVLCGLFFATQRSYERSDNGLERELFADIAGDEIAKVKIEKGGESTEITRRDGQWVVTSRSDYPADLSRVRSLLFRIKDVTVANKITDSPDNFEKLGVGEGASNQGHISFFRENGELLGGLFVGDDRRPKRDADFLRSPPQYIRRMNQNDVYLVKELIGFSASPKEWLDSSLIKLPAKELTQIAVFKGAAAASTAPEFVLTKPDPDSDTFALSAALPGGKQPKELSITQLSSALEDLKLRDVMKAEDDRVKTLSFDYRADYAAKNGLVYSVASAADELSGYLKITVSYDPSRVRQPTATPSEEKQNGKEKQAEPTTATEADAAKLNATFGPWVYVVEKYVVDRLRQTKDTLAQGTDEPSPAAAAPGVPFSAE